MPESPGSMGIERLNRQVVKLDGRIGDCLRDIAELKRELRAGISGLERMSLQIMGSLADLDAKLDAVAQNETKLGTDLRTVIQALKNLPNPPQDFTAQIAKLEAISQDLINSDAETLAALPSPPGGKRK